MQEIKNLEEFLKEIEATKGEKKVDWEYHYENLIKLIKLKENLEYSLYGLFKRKIGNSSELEENDIFLITYVMYIIEKAEALYTVDWIKESNLYAEKHAEEYFSKFTIKDYCELHQEAEACENLLREGLFKIVRGTVNS